MSAVEHQEDVQKWTRLGDSQDGSHVLPTVYEEPDLTFR